MTKELADLLARRFIQRRDVKAIQKNEAYIPHTTNGKTSGDYLPWTRADLDAHIAGEASFGHYLLDQDGQCKLFAFDIDLMKWDEQRSTRSQPTWVPIEEDGSNGSAEPKPLQPREAWKHPKAPPELRRFLTAQLRGMSDMLASIIVDTLDIPVAVAYSGNKGLHVYGFTGAAPAHDVRGAAMEILKYAGCFEALRGNNFFRHESDDPRTGYGCIEIEVFPKQSEVTSLGNLMRLPLGIHNASKRPAYFIDLNSHVDQLVEADPVAAMEGGNPWL